MSNQKKIEYVSIGTCIWCKRSKPNCTFNEKPHTFPRSLGGKNIGVDICDECNHYFGEPDLNAFPHLSVEVCFKEIFGIIRYIIELSGKERIKFKKPQERLRSNYFDVYNQKKRIVFRSAFRRNKHFLQTFTRQFKRSLYEVFLQEYHLKTGMGLNEEFNIIRDFARFNIGDIPVYHITNYGAILVPTDLSSPYMFFEQEDLDSIDNFGFYKFWIFGYVFYLEVKPLAKEKRVTYLNPIIKNAEDLKGLQDFFKLDSITQIDFTLKNLY